MKYPDALLSIVFTISISSLLAQPTRYLEPIFSQVEIVRNVHYATNISMLYSSLPMPQDLSPGNGGIQQPWPRKLHS